MSPVELEVLRSGATFAPPGAPISRRRYEQLAGRVRLLSRLSLGWMTIEGAEGITAGAFSRSATTPAPKQGFTPLGRRFAPALGSARLAGSQGGPLGQLFFAASFAVSPTA